MHSPGSGAVHLTSNNQLTLAMPPPPLASPSLSRAVRGEDYCFTFTGKLRDGKLHFRLHMQVRPSSLPCLPLGCAWVCGKCLMAAPGSLLAHSC